VTLLYTAGKHAMRASVAVSLRRNGNALALTIQDRGRGFPADVLHRFQLSAADMDSAHPASALSVGLTACKRACEAMGCQLELANAEPVSKRKGGMVHVHIPCAPEG
jgi:K+-sensing histidine kinase KdpD